MKYLLSIAAGAALLAAGYLALLAISAGTPATLEAAVIKAWYERKLNIADRLPSPRILVAGGSSNLYGIRAELIESGTGIPSVNLGTHAALSLDYHLHRVRQIARPGDIVILGLEYELYTDRGPNAVFSDFVFGGDPAYLASLPASEVTCWVVQASPEVVWRSILDLAPGRKTDRLQRATDRAAELNGHGDFVRNHLVEQQPHHRLAVENAPVVRAILRPKPMQDEAAWSRLAEFAAWCRERNITLLATFPATIRLPDHDRKPSQRAMSGLLESFGKLGIPTLGTPADFLQSRENFFDTGYHLNAEAAIVRTNRLLETLTPILESSGLSPIARRFDKQDPAHLSSP